MKKLTGYIGAMIIVFALMGSVLLGYALNINGTTEVINEYDEVTDVSGLYSYSDEKSYIAYKPASNYIGYREDGVENLTITNETQYGDHHKEYYKLFKDSFSGLTTTEWRGDAVYNDGVVVPFSGAVNNNYMNYYTIFLGENIHVYVYGPANNTQYATMELTSNGTTSTYYNLTQISISYYSNTLHISAGGQTFNIGCNWLLIPYLNGDYSGMITGTGYVLNPSDIYGNTPTTTRIYNYNGEIIINPLYTFNVSNDWNRVFVPKTVKYHYEGIPGIDYTESNRVNNYPIEYDHNTNITTVTQNLNLQALSVYDYYSGGEWIIQDSHPWDYYHEHNGVGVQMTGVKSTYIPRYTTYNLNQTVNCIHKYKLSDVLNLANIPNDTTMIKIEPSSTSKHSYSSGDYVSYNGEYHKLSTPSIPDQIIVFTDGSTNDNTLPLITKTLYYYPENDIIDIYDLNNVKIATQTLTNTYVQFVDDNGVYGKIPYTLDQNGTNGTLYYNKTNRITPTINLTMTVSGVITNTHYADITKGYKIDTDNVSNVIWDNTFENGKIQILFRADNTTSAYSNEITVSGNDISIDYAASRFSITLNGGDPVSVGMWRSIVLDIDLINGRLSAIPVRTFNNFTSVQMDSANIFIGNLTGSTPTNTITWKQTTNSLTFNIYETDVFMDTYGVVMVDPTLNITNYFTNLDQFYRLKIYNFSIYGSDITINGITGTVTGNNITFNGETVQLKEMYVTYADNHVYVEDGHVSIDLGTIATNDISMTGAWYFNTFLEKGHTSQKLVYDWDWSSFILDNTQFCIFYIGIALAGLIIARRFCSLSIIDYAIFITSIILALSIQVIA